MVTYIRIDLINKGMHIMGRRNDSVAGDIITMLLKSPWQVNLIITGVVYGFLKFILPIIPIENVILKPMTNALHLTAGWWALVLLIITAVSFIRSLNQSKKLEHQTGLRHPSRNLERQTGLKSIAKLHWKDFEYLMGEAYRRDGYEVIENFDAGADGGIDLKLRNKDELVLVQCKHWKEHKVGVKIVRELYGVIHSEGADRGIVVTSGNYTRDAIEFARGKSVTLINGEGLINLLSQVQKSDNIKTNQEQNKTNPCCPKCDSTMVMRTAKCGTNAGNQFWGCSKYPDCRGTVNI